LAASDRGYNPEHEIPLVYILALERINAKSEMFLEEKVVPGGEWTVGQIRYAKWQYGNRFNSYVCQPNEFRVSVNAQLLACCGGIGRRLFAIRPALLIRQIPKCSYEVIPLVVV
jgi:hypothetical protein